MRQYGTTYEDPCMPTPAEILDVLCEYVTNGLRDGIIQLVSTGDSRNDSTANERVIGTSLRAFTAGHPMFQRGLTFAVAPNRTWYDFLVSGTNPDDPWVPINLKVSTLRGNDNVSSKAGLFYALTGLRPTNNLVGNWDSFCRNAAENVRREDCDADYYFIVVEKNRGNEVGQVFWTSLLHIERVTPNGSNPPFQCRWGENTNRVVRPRAASVDALLDVVGRTFVLRAKALESFRLHVVPGMSVEMQHVWAGEGPVVNGEAG